jgi:futalosine hydrolase
VPGDSASATLVRMPLDLLICVATDLESGVLRDHLQGHADSIQLLRTGVGAVNAAHAVTLAIARNRPDTIVVCGIGGAYPGSGLTLGDVVCADVECYGDLGAATTEGFLDMQAMGFPVVDGPPALYNDLPLQLFPTDRRVKFVTVNTCTGTHAAALAIESRTRGSVENMEGAAIVHVAHLQGVPVGEVRGISNLVTDRNPATWRVRQAADAAQEALLAWIKER